MEAIRTFHTGVSEDVLLKQKELEELRTKLLRGAREFYRKLEAQLRGQTDPRALEALGGAYDEIGRLSDKIGSKEEGLEDLRRGLALRERLAGDDPRPGARAELGQKLRAIGSLLAQSGDHAEAIESYARARAKLSCSAAITPRAIASVTAVKSGGSAISIPRRATTPRCS